jgi:hypothetical protein
MSLGPNEGIWIKESVNLEAPAIKADAEKSIAMQRAASYRA